MKTKRNEKENKIKGKKEENTEQKTTVNSESAVVS